MKMNQGKTKSNFTHLKTSMTQIFLSASVIVLAACNNTGTSSSPAPAGGLTDKNLPGGRVPIVRIIEINDRDPGRVGKTADLYQGQGVRLRAELFDADGRDLGQAKENFVWFADDGNRDVCDAANPRECQRESNFIVTDEGVEFILSRADFRDVIVTVESKIGTALDVNGRPQVDSMRIENLGITPGESLPPTRPDPYPGPGPRPRPQPHPRLDVPVL